MAPAAARHGPDGCDHYQTSVRQGDKIERIVCACGRQDASSSDAWRQESGASEPGRPSHSSKRRLAGGKVSQQRSMLDVRCWMFGRADKRANQTIEQGILNV